MRYYCTYRTGGLTHRGPLPALVMVRALAAATHLGAAPDFCWAALAVLVAAAVSAALPVLALRRGLAGRISPPAVTVIRISGAPDRAPGTGLPLALRGTTDLATWAATELMVGGRGREGIKGNKAAAEGTIGARGPLSGSRGSAGGRQAIGHRSSR